MDPKISVIVPVYNAQRYLKQCLDSILTQTIQDLEIICVDDGSTDQSLHILEEYARRDTRILVLTQRNQHAGIARNTGMAAAKGTYLAFLDADDCFFPTALERLYALAERYCLDMVKGGFVYLDARNGRRYQTIDAVNGCISWLDRRRVLKFSQKPLRLLNVSDVPWNGLYRRDFIQKNGILFNHLICVNDHSFYVHCLLRAERLMVTQVPVACYRVGQDTSIIGRKAEHFDAQIASYRIVRELSQTAPAAISQAIMRNEWNLLFSWYQRLYSRAENRPQLDAWLSEFLQTFDETEVGADFLKSCAYWPRYWELRYGTAPPPQRRRNPILRGWECWREHGWRYTLQRLKNKRKG